MRITVAIILAAALWATGAKAAHVPAPDPAQGDGGVSTFYTWTDEIPGKPGQMLRTEPLDPALGLTMAGAQWRILYTSINGVDGTTPVVASGAYFAPKGAPPAGGWPLVAWAHGTTGIADVCAPSWNKRSERDAAYLNAWLAQGYAIVATDYQGLGTPGPHPYLAVRPEAYSVLDSVRAVLKGFPNVANKIVIIGQSQGGQAAFATAGAAPAYAPELNVRGTVGTGVPFIGGATLQPAADPIPLDRADPTVTYSFYIGFIMQQTEPALSADELFTPAALPLFAEARTACVGQMFRDVSRAGLNRQTALKKAYAGAFLKVMSLMEYSTLHLQRPMFVGTGERDHDVPPSRQLALVRNACAQGSVIEAHLYAGKDHGQTVNASLKDSEPFVRRILAGEPVTAVCDPVAE